MPTEPLRRSTPQRLAGRIGRALGASLLLLAFVGVATAFAADLGHKDIPYVNGSGGISGSKPESKLWFNDGLWWGSLWDDSTSDFYIYRLDPNTDSWVKTSTRLDDRSGSRADVLWDGTKLYVASQRQSDNGGSGSGSNFEARLYRFSYNSSTKTYTNDAGGTSPFGIIRTGWQTETLVIAKDSTNTLWATWTQNTTGGNRLVYTNHTLNGNDATWSSGVALPVGSQGVGVTTDGDDISTIVAFKKDSTHNAVAVLWSNQIDKRDYLAVHVDGDPDSTWTAETVIQPHGSSTAPADDHLNLKADSTGRLFAAIKTSNNSSGTPEIEVLVRPAGGGSWAEYVATTGNGNNNTRPIVVLDEAGNKLHLFYTGGQPPDTTGVGGGIIFEKTSSMSSVSLTGSPTAVIRDDTAPGFGTSSVNGTNNATSTKQNVSSSTGLVVEASEDASASSSPDHRYYWHIREALSGGGAPVPDFSATPTSGPPGQQVAFTDLSSNGPTSWAWDFGDPGSGVNNTSALQNPSHTYASAGQYTVKLTATNGSGSNQATKTNYITISSGGGSTITLTPDADAQIKVGSSSTVSDTTHLRTREENPVASATYRSYLRFNVQGVTGTITGVKLRLYVTTASTNTQSVWNTTGNPNWPEATANSTNTPTFGATQLGSIVAGSAGAYVEIPLSTTAVSGNGLVTFGLKSNGTTSAYFASKELTSPVDPPQLVITQAPAGTPPTANATSATTNEDNAVSVPLSGSDAETCELTFSLVTAPTRGTVNFAGQTPAACVSGSPNTDSASVTYTPNANANGADSFTYKVTDGSATDSAPATASITINAVDDPPVADGGSKSTPQDTPVVVTIGGHDVDSCELTFAISTSPSNGTLTFPTDQACVSGSPNTDTQQITYTPNGGYTGSDTFQFTVADATSTSAPATVNLTVTQPNTPPTADNKSPSTSEDTALPITLSGGDAETCDLSFTIVSPPSHGGLGSISNNACSGSGPYTDSASVTYTPAGNYSGGDSFTYKVNDGITDSASATVTITVTAVNDKPTADAVSVTTNQNTLKTVTLTGHDVEDCNLTFTIVGSPSNGTLGSITPAACSSGNPNTDTATIDYTPTNGFSGSDSFTYKVTDSGSMDSTSATVSITVNGSNPTSTTLNPVADAQVQSGGVNSNYGTLTPFRTREGADPIYRLFFKFDLSSVSGTVQSAKLRLYVTTAAASDQTVYAVSDTTWTELGVTWATAPTIGAAGPSAVSGNTAGYIEIPVSVAAIHAGALTSLAVEGSTTKSVYFNSRESPTNKPELVIVTQ